MTRVRRFAPWVISAALLAGCGTQVVNPVTGRTERTVMDEPAEIAQGQKMHQEVLKQYGVYDNPRVQAYVNEVGQKLASQSHRAQLKWTFTVLDSTEVNAFALPGGYVYITRGIMAYLDNEAQLAGVLGHEIGHVTARHGAQRATQQQTAGFGVLAATVLGAVLESQGLTGATDLASQVSQTTAAGFIASYSREHETQADELGAEYLARNHYDPRNMVDVIGVLKRQERFAADQARAEGRPAPAGANWLSSHPSNDQRLADIRTFAARYSGPDQGQYGDDRHAAYLKAIDGMVFGDSPEQGVTRGRHFYHEGLGIALTAPAGWRVSNTADAVTLINGEANAALILRPVPAAAGSTPEAVIRQVLQPTEGRSEARQLNGLRAMHFVGSMRDDKGQAKGVRATAVSGPLGRQYLLLYAAQSAEAMQAALPQLQVAEGSFRALTAADRQAAKPWHLVSVAYPRGGFAELARQSPLGDAALARLQLINGVYGGGPVPAPGQLVKAVQ